MAPRLCLLFCDNIFGEAARIIEEEGFSDVVPRMFPAACGRHGQRWGPVVESLQNLVDDCDTAIVFGGACIHLLGEPPEELEHCEFSSLEQCHHFFTNRELLEDYLARGDYAVTPGWLVNWRRHLEDWGFDAKTAREFFGECSTKLLLLDTGIYPDSDERLREFADFLGLPFETLHVGLNHFRLFLTKVVLEWRLENEKQAVLESVTASSRRGADAELAVEMMSSLTGIRAEEQVVESLLETYRTLFAPSSVIYVAVLGGKADKCWSRPADPAFDDKKIQSLGAFRAGHEVAGGGEGFTLEVRYSDETLGVIEVAGIAFPKYVDHYIELALAIARVFGLAVYNARIFQELGIANTALQGYAHTVSHDLRGPLANVMMSAELARSIVADILKEEQATDLVELFDIMDGSLGRMLSLISDILTMAEAGQKPELVSEVAISDIVSAIAGEKAADICSGRLDLKVDENLGAVIANHTQMYQLFLNLISNAIKHNDSDSLVVQVRYLGDDHRGGHRYLVRDNGTGIAQENLDKIFQPFFKSGKGADTGVGLATVDKIVKVHCGDIKAYNDGGACFEFVIRDLGD